MQKESVLSVRSASIAGAAVAMLFAAGCSRNEQPPTERTGSLSPKLQTHGPALAPSYDPQTLVVEVNGKGLTYGEADKVIRAQIASMGDSIPPGQRSMLRDQLLRGIIENFIARALLTQEAARLDIRVSEEDRQEALEQIRLSLPEGMTMQDMMAEDGISDESMHKELAEALLINKLIEHITKQQQEISEDEMQDFRNEHAGQLDMPARRDARHILIALSPDDSEEDRSGKKEKAAGIRSELLAGADFAELAAKHSDCPSSRLGGALGVFPKGRMVPAFEDAAFRQEVGEIGEVIETQFGYHIIQVTEAHESGPVSDEQVREILSGMKGRSAIRDRIEALRKDADIKVGAEFKHLAE